MDQSEQLYQQFTELYMQNLNLTEGMTVPSLANYTITEMHILQRIQEIDAPNITKLASSLHISKGAVCKNVKKLLKKGDIDSYMKAKNKKEIYYKLTPQGIEHCMEHSERREKSVERDLQFFRSLPAEEINTVSSFLTKFLDYLSGFTSNEPLDTEDLL